tara:strand:+ start:12257 stop:13795 length:1539 start_codon:yes stop_codon:yes gene_type:complete
MATGLDKIGVLSWEMTLDVHGFQNKIKDSVKSLKKLDQDGTKGLRRVSSGFNLATVAAGLFTISLTKLVAESVKVAGAYDKIDNGLKTVFGSAEDANKEFEFLKNISEDLGLSLRSAATGFVQVSAAAKGTTLEGEGVKNLFIGVAEASTALGLSADESKGALRAISQVMSKGKVQAEELRGQLGERIPGAFQIAARAMNMTTSELDKMLVRGELLSEDFLPKFGAQLRKEFGDSAQSASNSIVANTNRMKNAWEGTMKGMGATAAEFFPIVTSGLNRFNEGVAEAIALRNKFLGINEFDPANDNTGEASSKDAIEGAMTAAQLERRRIKELGKEGRAEELRIAKELLEEEKKIKSLKSFTDFAKDKQAAEFANDVAKGAGLTKLEFEAMKPALEQSFKDGAKLADAIKEAQVNAKLFGKELNSGAKIDPNIFKDIDNMQKSLEKAADKARKKRIDDLKDHARKQDPRAFAQRAMAGSVEEFKILAGQDTTAKKSEKHLSKIERLIDQLEAV